MTSTVNVSLGCNARSRRSAVSVCAKASGLPLVPTRIRIAFAASGGPAGPRGLFPAGLGRVEAEERPCRFEDLFVLTTSLEHR